MERLTSALSTLDRIFSLIGKIFTNNDIEKMCEERGDIARELREVK
jgi:hypothetical protein